MSDPPDEDLDAFIPEEGSPRRDNVTEVDFKKPRRKKTPPPPPPGGWASWYDKLRRDNGRIIPDLANVLIALREDQALVFAMAFNEMRQRSIAMTEWPLAARALPGEKPPHDIGEDDITRLQEWLQHMGLPRIGREIVAQAVEAFARERRVHPIRDWLDSLESDGGDLRQNWLTVCLGVPDDPYHRAIGKMFLTSMVARIFEPGCKCDYMIVLEGPQGEEKSKFCRALAGGEYFSEHLPRIDTDPIRLSMHLRGKWLIEVSELSAFLKADPEAMKHFVSQQNEQYTPKYGRSEVTEPRQCVFIGTTNEDEYIRDVTGGRRYWPIKVRFVNVDRLERMRAQLFAETVLAYRANEAWWPERSFEKEVITPVQDLRQWEDALTEKVGDVIDALSEITLAQLGARLGFDNTRLDTPAQKRIAAILRKAGWRKGNLHGGRSIWRKPQPGDPW
jgi:predicted P-loop ATPase